MAWKESSGGRECKDINGMFAAVKDVLPSETFLECCTLSVSKVEKAYAKQLKDSGKCKTEKDGKAEFTVSAGLLVTEKPKKRSLVKKDDVK
jgi:peroxiredoxin